MSRTKVFLFARTRSAKIDHKIAVGAVVQSVSFLLLFVAYVQVEDAVGDLGKMFAGQV